MIRIEACAKGDRHAATQAATDAISGSGACILDSRFYSGIALAIVFEIDRDRTARLIEALRAAGFTVQAPAPEPARATAERLVQGTLSITFADGDPDLRRTVPSVPG